MPDIAITFLSVLFLLQLFLPKTRFNKVGFLFFSVSLILVFSFAGFQSWQQYSLWKADELGKLFLPPYQSWDYFIFYVSAHFFNSYLLSLLIGLLFFFGARKLNKKYGERFFEEVEPYLLAVSIFLAGHPGWIFYLIFILIMALVVNSYLTYKSYRTNKPDGSYRISFYHQWLPVALFTIIISKWLATLPMWQSMKF